MENIIAINVRKSSDDKKIYVIQNEMSLFFQSKGNAILEIEFFHIQ